MMPRSSLGMAVVDGADQPTAAGMQNTPRTLGVLPPHEFAGSSEFSETCFEHCSPIRTRCPGPAAALSLHKDGHWLPICRRALS
jgi:hypothetical protein